MAFGGETAESYYDEGLTALMKGEVSAAVRCFERAIGLDREYGAAYHQLARCYLRQGDRAKAVRILTPLVQSKPDNIQARLDLGAAYVQLGEIQLARAEFAQVLERQKDNSRAYLGMAQVSFLEGNWEAALQLAESARALGGSSFGVLFILGRAAKLAGRVAASQSALEEAEAMLEQSIELSPAQPEGYYLRGEVCFVRDQIPAALEQFRLAGDRAEPQKSYGAFGEFFTYSDVLAKQGLCLQRLGQLDRAREIGERILKADPEHKLGQALAALE